MSTGNNNSSPGGTPVEGTSQAENLKRKADDALTQARRSKQQHQQRYVGPQEELTTVFSNQLQQKPGFPSFIPLVAMGTLHGNHNKAAARLHLQLPTIVLNCIHGSNGTSDCSKVSTKGTRDNGDEVARIIMLYLKRL